MSDNIQDNKNEIETSEKSDKVNQIFINISQSTFDSSSSNYQLTKNFLLT